MAVIDAHLHLWDLASGDYGWIPPGPLDRTFSLADARTELAAAGVDAAVLVQAADTEADTRAMLAAAGDPFVAGVVGWVRLDDPATAAAQLHAYGDRLCGVRHLVHDDPRDDFLELPAVRESLGLLAARGLPLDVPDAWPRHLPGLASFADDHPQLTIVVDHLGKPPRGTDAMTAWEKTLRALAERPNTVAKVSGLQSPGQPFTTQALRPVWELALEAFGPARLLYGGDWPMTVPDGGYDPHWHVVSALVGELAPAERDEVLGATAARVYRIGAAR
ncbi:amidohydrolase family protein [Nocardioides sp. CER19]|uniref:amidohydrolase family protein n=1 Tax=Nocardioides sp. CER19 TaxID=3038538 RepID=UPI002448326B|nr:amidohydrolase family protein [Nocardioides sp. CER19]MDH2412751.1 amidohydrolase family protein [Nocardioides sp. CER19]